MVKTCRFISESKGQASALDILFFALLVSLATWMVTSLGLAVHNDDATMEELRGRYAMDIAHSFGLSARYVTDSNELLAVTYALGPGNPCSGGFQGVFNRLSDTITSISGKSPLNRTLRASFLDLIADDLYLSLGFQTGDKPYSLSNSLLTGCFHEQLDSALKRHITFISGAAFGYRIDASWRPYKGTRLDDFVYSTVSYGDEFVPGDSPIYVTSFLISLPVDEEELSNFNLALKGYLDGLGEIAELFSGHTGRGQEDLLEIAGEMENTSPIVNEKALVTIRMWPKEVG